MGQLSNLSLNGITDLVENSIHLVNRNVRVDLFHLDELLELEIEISEDDGIGDLLLGHLRFKDCSLGVLKEADNTLHHTDGLVERASVIVSREGVLLEEIFSDEFGDFEDTFLIFRE
jgi:hypothetical protein